MSIEAESASDDEADAYVADTEKRVELLNGVPKQATLDIRDGDSFASLNIV